MKLAPYLVVLSIVLLIVLIRADIVDALFYFLMIGAVPGTSINLSPTVMLTIIMLVLWLCIVRYASTSHIKRVTDQ